MHLKTIETSLQISEWIEYIKKSKVQIDLLITDPPYPFDNKNGSGRHKFKDGSDDMYHRMTWDSLKIIYNDFLDLTAPGGRAYIFSNRDGYEKTKEIMQEVGWRYLNTLIWDKERFGGGYHWRNSVEYIHYFCKKPKPAVLVKGAKNLFRYSKPKKSDAIPEINYNPASNASPKPNQLWRDIIKFGGKEGDIVADPFSGSNPLKAALYLNPELVKKIDSAYLNSFDI